MVFESPRLFRGVFVLSLAALIAAQPGFGGNEFGFSRFRVSDPGRVRQSVSPLPCAEAILQIGVESGLKSFLNRFAKIRMLIVHAPGFGHQMSGIALAQRVEELGFKGTLEIVHEEYVDAKLRVLVPGFQTGVEKQRIGNRVFLTREYFHSHASELGTVELGLMGAEDEQRNFIPLPDRPTRPAVLRVRVLLRLQAANWTEGTQTLETITGQTTSLNDLNGLPYVITQPKLTIPSGFTRILDRSHPIEIAPYYNAHTNRVSTLLHYLTGIASAVEIHPNLFDGGVVVPALSEMSSYNLERFKIGLSESATLRDRVTLIVLSNNDVIPPPSPGKITVVIAPGLSPALNQVLLSRATIPPAIAGRYSQGILLQLGIPFMETNFTDLLDEIRFGDGARSLFLGSSFEFDSETPLPLKNYRGEPNAIGRFIVESRADGKLGDELRATYRQGIITDREKQDKVIQGLLRAKALVDQ